MFDTKKFMTTHFLPREEDVPVPDMKDFFEEGKEPVWRVRGLTGQELGVANETVERNRRPLAEVLEKMVASLSVKDVEAAAEKVKDPDRITDEIAKRLEMFVIGSVSPKASMELAIKVCKVNGVEFFEITNVINRLTGLGQEAKKKPESYG